MTYCEKYKIENLTYFEISKECGLAYLSKKNLNNYGYDTVVRGDAQIMPAFSYPSTVLVKFYFYSMARQGNRTYNPYFTTRCLGSIVNRRTVLTIGSCLPKSFNFTPVNYRGQWINVKADLNEFYPTYGSMYSVWIAIHKFMKKNPGMDIKQVADFFEVEIELVEQARLLA